MARPNRPFLLLDVDGVLNPFAVDQCPAGYEEFHLFPDEEPVRLCPAHGDWLHELGERFEMVWATGWGPTRTGFSRQCYGFRCYP